MTTVAEPTVPSATSPGRVSHWIGGRVVAGSSGRQGDIYDPATGATDPPRRLRLGSGTRRCRRGCQGGLPGLAGDLAEQADGHPVQDPEPRRGPPPRARGPPDRRTRQGPVGCPRRDRARPREPRIRVRHPEPAQGRLLRAGEHRRGRLPDPPAARCRGRHHAVQLPGDGPDVDVRDGHRDRQHVHPQALGEGPLGLDVPGRVPPRGRRPRRRVQRRARRQGRGRCHPRPPGHRRGQLRRLDADRPLHLRDRARRPASGSRPSVAPRTT